MGSRRRRRWRRRRTTTTTWTTDIDAIPRKPRSVDPKLLERPVTFSGAPKDWRAWRVRFAAWLAGVDDKYDMSLKMAERPDPITSVDESIKYLDRFLFIQLIGLVQGEYLDMILEAPSGFEAWRKLCMEFEQLTAGRKLLAIEDLIHPDFGDETVWRAQWLNWERVIERGAVQTGLRLPDDVRIAIV